MPMWAKTRRRTRRKEEAGRSRFNAIAVHYIKFVGRLRLIAHMGMRASATPLTCWPFLLTLVPDADIGIICDCFCPAEHCLQYLAEVVT